MLEDDTGRQALRLVAGVSERIWAQLVEARRHALVIISGSKRLAALDVIDRHQLAVRIL